MFPRALRSEVVALLCVKVVALVLIYQFLFAPSTRPEPDGHRVLAHLLSAGQH